MRLAIFSLAALFLLLGFLGIRSLGSEEVLLEYRLERERKEAYQEVEERLGHQWEEFLSQVEKEVLASRNFPEKFFENKTCILALFRWDDQGRPLYPPALVQRFKAPPVENFRLYGQFLQDLSRAQALQLEKRNYRRAIEVYQKILDRYSQPYRANALLPLASCYLHRKEKKKALEIYRKLCRQYLSIRHSSGVPLAIYAYFQHVKLLRQMGKSKEARKLCLRYQDLFLRNPWEMEGREILPFRRQNEKILESLTGEKGLNKKEREKLDRARWMELIKRRFPSHGQGVLRLEGRVLALPHPAYGLVLDEEAFWEIEIKEPVEAFCREKEWEIEWKPRRERERGEKPQFIEEGNFPSGKFSLTLKYAQKEWRQLHQRSWLLAGFLALAGVSLLLSLWIAYGHWKRSSELLSLKSDFLNTVSHELKTPVTSIRMSAEVLGEDDFSPGKLKSYSRLITRETRRLERLINNILTFSGLQAGKVTLSRESHRLEEIVDYLSYVYGDLLESEDIELATSIPPDITLWCDRDRLVQVFINLLSNSIKYTPRGGRIILEATEEDGGVQIVFRDTGKGIDPQEREKIFEKFYSQSHHPTDGVGLGLVIVQSLLREMEGDIRLLSSEEGASFEITLKGDRLD